MTIEWKYTKTGTCDRCPDEDARLWAPVCLPPLRMVVPPMLCARCKLRVERALSGLAEITDYTDFFRDLPVRVD